jgi:quercetin dioxygenase-like cupin family protein
MTTPDYYRPLRRLVTGVDADGRSQVTSDSLTADTEVTPEYVLDDLWSMTVPAVVDGPLVLPDHPGADIAPASGLFRRCTIPANTTIGFHTTDTVDCITVVSGSVTLILETGEVEMSTGDCVVQRNTVHGWRTSGSEPCVLIGVMASIKR